MNQRIQDAFFGALLALAAFGALVFVLWEPVIQPKLNASANQAGKNALSGLLSSVGIGS
jgi:hypothetical protein